MRPPVLPSGNPTMPGPDSIAASYASMRPPVLPSGNPDRGPPGALPRRAEASMRPPVLPSGNSARQRCSRTGPPLRFNEAAGFTQRKLGKFTPNRDAVIRAASMRPPVLPSGNTVTKRHTLLRGILASMRPPVLPSGNPGGRGVSSQRQEVALQ